jgi:hypothetical protein
MRKFSEHEQYAAHGLVAHSYALTAARYRRLLSVLEEHEQMRAALKHIADASDCLDDSPDQIALHVIGCMGALGMFQAGAAPQPVDRGGGEALVMTAEEREKIIGRAAFVLAETERGGHGDRG